MSINTTNLEQINKICISKNIEFVAVTKTKSIETLIELYNLGIRNMGENKAQELCDKFSKLPSDIHWHFIGHLQSNKVVEIIDKVSLIHSVDSLKLLNTIQKEAYKINKSIDILIQVHIAQEENKFGFSLESAFEFFKSYQPSEFPNINIKGLMGMATFTENTELIRSEFKTLFNLKMRIVSELKFNLKHLSMGMSGDYLIAIEEGSTMIRVGSYIFNPESSLEFVVK